MFSLSSDETQLAILDVHTASKLGVLRQIPRVRCEAVVENRTALKRKSKSSSRKRLLMRFLTRFPRSMRFSNTLKL